MLTEVRWSRSAAPRAVIEELGTKIANTVTGTYPLISIYEGISHRATRRRKEFRRRVVFGVGRLAGNDGRKCGRVRAAEKSGGNGETKGFDVAREP